MERPLIPIKTPAGQAELGSRERRISQRHRTMLLLVDGRRTEAQVRKLSAQAGVPDSCFDELLSLGLIAVPDEGVTAQATLGSPATTRADLRPDMRSEVRPHEDSTTDADPRPDSRPDSRREPRLDARQDSPLDIRLDAPAAPRFAPRPGAPATAVMRPVGRPGPPAPPPHASALSQRVAPAAERSAAVRAPQAQARAHTRLEAMAVAPPISRPMPLDDGSRQERIATIHDLVLNSDFGDEAEMPAMRTLPPESAFDDTGMGELTQTPNWPDTEPETDDTGDPVLERARDILLKAVQKEAPVAGSLTMLRLRRARSRAEIEALMGEVASRIGKPPRTLHAAQVLRRVRDVLDGRDTAPAGTI